jgi:hypothetical protein
MADTISYDSFFDMSQGMYGDDSSSGDMILEERDEIESLNDLGSLDLSDVYGQTVSENADNETETIEFSKNPFTVNGDKSAILGLPLKYNTNCDPNGRVFKKTLYKNMPIVYIIPGKGVLNGKLIDDNGSKVSAGNLLKLLADQSSESIKWAVKGMRSGKDMRFIGFKSWYNEYYKYVEKMLNTVWINMGFKGTYHFNDTVMKKLNLLNSNNGLCFYCTNSTSISESASNDYSQSTIVQKANDMSCCKRI